MRCLLLFVLVIACASAPAMANVVTFEGLGPANTWQSSGGWFGGTFAQTCAVQFTPTVTGSFEELYAAIEPDPYATDRSYTLRILADVGNYPGASLWETSASVWPVPNGEVFHLEDLGGPMLVAGQPYWLQADKPLVSEAGHLWSANDQGYKGSIALAHSGNPWSIHDNQDIYGLRVLVAVPEPATVGLLALGLAVMTARRKKA